LSGAIKTLAEAKGKELVRRVRLLVGEGPEVKLTGTAFLDKNKAC
jgi:hypothetical protein